MQRLTLILITLERQLVPLYLSQYQNVIMKNTNNSLLYNENLIIIAFCYLPLEICP